MVFAFCLLSTAALAADPAWMQAQGVAQATGADVANNRNNLLVIESHVGDLEKALAEGAVPAPPAADGKAVILTDGPGETLFAMAEAAAKKQNAVAERNPYPDVTLYLALYYNEVRRYDDALRVIEAGLKLARTPDMGEHLPTLFTERATAYAGLKRFDAALASCEAGLTLVATKNADRARIQRCRGFDLTELGRLDEAEAAYNESLKLEPDDPLAKQELGYIARLRAGNPKAPADQITVQPPGNDRPKTVPPQPTTRSL